LILAPWRLLARWRSAAVDVDVVVVVVGVENFRLELGSALWDCGGMEGLGSGWMEGRLEDPKRQKDNKKSHGGRQRRATVELAKD
jgi:hypothetical protein